MAGPGNVVIKNFFFHFNCRLPSFNSIHKNDIKRTPDSLGTLEELSQSKFTNTFELTFLFKWLSN